MIEFFSMTESTSPTSTRRLNFPRILEVIFHPSRTFGIIIEEAKPSWLTPMLTLSISSSLAVIVSGYLKARAAMMGDVQLPPDWEFWTPEMQNNFTQAQQATQGATFVYIIPLVSSLVVLWLGWLILSGLLHLGSTLLGGRGSMSMALNVVAWANLPFMLRDVLRVIFMLIAGHAIVSPGLSGFADGSIFLAKILARVDVFFIWNAILLVIGFGISEGLTKNKAIIGVTIVLLIILLALAGAGTLTSSLGSLSA